MPVTAPNVRWARLDVQSPHPKANVERPLVKCATEAAMPIRVDDGCERNAPGRRRQVLGEGRIERLGPHRSEELRDAKFPEVPDDEREGHEAGRPLHRVEPVLRVRIAYDVGSPFERELHSVDGVKPERQEDAEHFDERQEGQMVDVSDRAVEGTLPLERLRVRPEVRDQEDSHREHAGQRVDPAKPKPPSRRNQKGKSRAWHCPSRGDRRTL